MKTAQAQYREFFITAYLGLVLRGHDRERDIPDPILRKVWRLGKRLNEARRKRNK